MAAAVAVLIPCRNSRNMKIAVGLIVLLEGIVIAEAWLCSPGHCYGMPYENDLSLEDHLGS